MSSRLVRVTLVTLFAASSVLAQSSGLAALSAPLSPSAVSPPAEGFAAGGRATVLIHTTRDDAGALTRALVDFQLDFATEASDLITKIHLHRGPRATKGPVVINAELGAEVSVDPGAHHLFRQRVLIDQDSLDAVEDILADPSAFYLNVHSANNDPGLIRGQLMHADSAEIAALRERVDTLAAENANLSAELDGLKQTLARVARRLGVVPAQ